MTKEASQLIFLAWDESHAALFDDISKTYPSAIYFPINQKAAAPYLERGGVFELPPFWSLYDPVDLDHIDSSADAFLMEWGETAEHELNVTRAWVWARERAHVDNLLASVERHMGSSPGYLVPRRSKFKSTCWHGGHLVPMSAMRSKAESGAFVQWVDATESSTDSETKISCSSSRRFEVGNDWILFSTFGIPDLIYHMSKLLEVGKSTILLLVDSSDPLPLEIVNDELFRSNPRVHISYVDHGTCTFDFNQLEKKGGSAESWLLETGPNYEKLREQLGRLVNVPALQRCIVSDHLCPQTSILSRLCAEKNIPVHYVPHSSWPMEGAFSALHKADRGNSCFFASTRLGINYLSQLHGDLVDKRPMPSPRYLPSLSRCWRRIQQWGFERESRPLSLGIVITSGEEVSAPDMAIADIAKDLQRLMSFLRDAKKTINVFVRLRAQEDRRIVLEYLSEGTRQKKISWEVSTTRASMEFLREMDLVIELGTRGTIMLESFSQLTPFLHFGGGGLRRIGYKAPAWVVPRVSMDAAGEEFLPYVESRWSRIFLAARQFGYLVLQTLPANTVGNIASRLKKHAS